MFKSTIGLTALLVGAGLTAHAQPVTVVTGEDLAPTGLVDIGDIIRTTPQAQTGFNYRGKVQLEYRAWDTIDEFAIGGNVKLGYGFDLGNGTATLGVNITGEYSESYGENFELNPFGSYKWGENKISIGNIRSSYDYVNRPFNWTTSIIRNNYGSYPLGLRFDTTIGNSRISASYDEYENFALGAKYDAGDNFQLYGALQYNLDSEQARSAIGIKGSLGEIDYRVGWDCLGSDDKWLEGEIKYDFSDRITGIGYVGANFHGGSTDMYYSVAGLYHLNDKVDLFAGYEHSSYSDDITIGAKIRFGNIYRSR